MKPREDVFDVIAIEAQIKINKEREDNFAIDFAEYLGENEFTMFSKGNWYSGFGRSCTTKELLEMYKKERL